MSNRKLAVCKEVLEISEKALLDISEYTEEANVEDGARSRIICFTCDNMALLRNVALRYAGVSENEFHAYYQEHC